MTAPGAGIDPALERMRSRVEQIQERAIVRAWEDRQRNSAAGVWQRLRRVLVDAAEAWAIPSEAADRLEAEGYAAHPVGAELEPPKRLIFVDRERIAGLPAATRIPVRLSAEFLQARDVALAPHRPGQ